MIHINRVKLENAINAISRLASIDESKKQELISRYASMPDQDTIKELFVLAHRVFSSNEESYNYALAVIRNIDEGICPPIEEIKSMLSKMFANDIEGHMSIEENHKLVSDSIVRFTTLFNQAGIDYYIVGALPCFLKAGIPLFRYHDDIDIMVNESDIPKIAELISQAGYIFYDDRFPTAERFQEMQENEPPHTVLAQNPDNEFHLGFFTFRREQDSSITMREYSHRIEDGEVAVDVLERVSDPVGTALRYDETPTEYLGTSFKTSSIESVYDLKEYMGRPKDITDASRLEPFVDGNKLAQIKDHKNQTVTFQNVSQPSQPTDYHL